MVFSRIHALLPWSLPIAAIAVLLAWEIRRGNALLDSLRIVPALVGSAVDPALLPEYGIDGGLAAHTQTVARTLFNPTRKPAPRPVTEAPIASLRRNQFMLTGTTISGDKSVAFLRELAGQRTRIVSKGDELNGMVVVEIHADHVKLAAGEDAEDIRFKVASSRPGMALPAGPPPLQAGDAHPSSGPASTAGASVTGAAATAGPSHISTGMPAAPWFAPAPAGESASGDDSSVPKAAPQPVPPRPALLVPPPQSVPHDAPVAENSAAGFVPLPAVSRGPTGESASADEGSEGGD